MANASVKQTAATVTIQYDGVRLLIEAPGLNGVRQKIEGVSFKELPVELRTTLLDQLDRIRARERAELMSIQADNINYVAANHGTWFARKVWKGENIESRTMRGRLNYSSASAGNVDESGRLKSEGGSRTSRHLPPPMDL